MFDRIRQIFRAPEIRATPAIPPGQRVYAIGDIHGRLDLFAALVDAIEADDASRAKADTAIVLLGDLVDRGPDSAGVIALAQALTARRKVRIVAGNHEEMFLRSFDDTETFRHFLRFGGRETILSYPIDREAYRQADIGEAQVLMQQAVPEADRTFLAGFEDGVTIGDYLFVHAGIRPGVGIDDQSRMDLRWIREPFLSHAGSHGVMVVHGHTITDEPVIAANRIGIDTGAYRSGRLTALGLEGTERWIVEAAASDGDAIAVSTRAA